jgi:hypothetical protein
MRCDASRSKWPWFHDHQCTTPVKPTSHFGEDKPVGRSRGHRFLLPSRIRANCLRTNRFSATRATRRWKTPPKKGTTSEATRKSAERDLKKGHGGKQTKPAAKRSRARIEVLKRESRSAASKPALSKHAKQAAGKRRARGKVTSSGGTQ